MHADVVPPARRRRTRPNEVSEPGERNGCKEPAGAEPGGRREGRGGAQKARAGCDRAIRAARDARPSSRKACSPPARLPVPPNPLEFFRYAQDVAQRQVLFWDTLRQRGDQFVERTAQGLPPVLHFDYEVVLDGRSFERPVNYALLKITPPEGVVVDRNKRPYIIIDPRAGHGPGIGGFKDDSQVGVALKAGHPVYFVIFYPDPEPGQTLIDVTRGGAALRQEGARAPPQERQAGAHRQLPGRLGRDDARDREPRRHRAGRDQRRADVVLERRVERRRERQPDAIRRRHARRHPGPRRWRPTWATASSMAPIWCRTSKTSIRPTASGTSGTTCSTRSTPSRRVFSTSSAGGAATT